jgi:hypothetical protein
LGDQIIFSLKFDDEIALLTNNEHDLEKALEEMLKCFQKYHFIINWQNNLS